MNYSPRTGRRRLLALLVGGVTVGTTLIGGAVTSSAVALPALARTPAATAPYKIVLSNNFLGNDWRPEMDAWLP